MIGTDQGPRLYCRIETIKRSCGEKDKIPKGIMMVKGGNIPIGVGDKNCSCWEDFLNYWTPDSERYKRSKHKETGTEHVCEKRQECPRCPSPKSCPKGRRCQKKKSNVRKKQRKEKKKTQRIRRNRRRAG